MPVVICSPESGTVSTTTPDGTDVLYLEHRSTGHVSFGGIGGGITRVTIKSETWKMLSSPEAVVVSVAASPTEEPEPTA